MLAVGSFSACPCRQVLSPIGVTVGVVSWRRPRPGGNMRRLAGSVVTSVLRRPGVSWNAFVPVALPPTDAYRWFVIYSVPWCRVDAMRALPAALLSLEILNIVSLHQRLIMLRKLPGISGSNRLGFPNCVQRSVWSTDVDSSVVVIVVSSTFGLPFALCFAGSFTCTFVA